MTVRRITVRVAAALFLSVLLGIVLMPKAAQAISPNWWSPMTSGTTNSLHRTAAGIRSVAVEESRQRHHPGLRSS